VLLSSCCATELYPQPVLLFFFSPN
jgi:hypothetical protein